MTPERLGSLIELFPGRRIGVIGDFFLDKYLEVDPALAEPSLETGKTAHQVVRIRMSPGAAGNVVSNLSSLGAGALHAIGFTGDDGGAYELESRLQALGCTTDRLFKVKERMTPTYIKPRDIHVQGLEGEYERFDIKNRTVTPTEVEKKLIESLDVILPDLDALLIVNQVEEEDCGVITGNIRKVLSERALDYPDVVFFADSRSNILLFRNIIIKPNQFELPGIKNLSCGDTIDSEEIKKAVISLRKETKAPIFITFGAKGILVSDPEPMEVRGVQVPDPIDPTGAGDSASAGIVMALVSGATVQEAALIGNLAASVTLHQLAVCGVCSPEELLPRLKMWLEQG